MWSGPYVAQIQQQAFSAADELIELQLGGTAGLVVEILRAWVSPDQGAPTDEVYPIQIYGNDAASTGGSALTEQALNGAPGASAVAAIGDSGTAITIGATPTVLLEDAFHAANGWLYLPVPEERIGAIGGGTIDNIGLRLPVTPTAELTVSAGIVWRERRPS